MIGLDALRDYLERLFSEAYDPWVILIELLLIGAVVYSAMRFLRGTRGARLMQGIGLVILIAFVIVRRLAQEFHWERIEFLFQYFVGAVFLLVLVVFQPELRRAFMRIGERSWFSTLFKKSDDVIDAVVTSVAHLSKKRIGALIAIERVTGLSAIIDSGVTLEAKVSTELLNTIFWPGSALHDMGVIIRQGVIAAAGCQFPLADSEDLDRSLGSRHRAALGLSNESDVVVIVVSEETGTISLAHRAKLYRPLSPQQLRRMMFALLAGQDLPVDDQAADAEEHGKYAA